MLSIYFSSPFTVYCNDCFYSDGWDPRAYGQEYDFSKPFFQQLYELGLRAPKLTLQKSQDLVNCDYVNHVAGSRNCYLIFASVNNENCFYSNYVNYSKEVFDSLRVWSGEVYYECTDCNNSYNLRFSEQSHTCIDSLFLYNCRGCSSCFLSSNLVKRSYCIRNKQYTKEEYHRILNTVDTGDKNIVENLKKEFEILKKSSPRRSLEGFDNDGSSGNYLKHTKNCRNCFDLSEAENCRNVEHGSKVKDSMDIYGAYPTTELCYESVAMGSQSYHCLFSYLGWDGVSNLSYCINAFPSCQDCFGCIQIRNKSYCILNKQYTKEEYEKMVPRIIEHMNQMPYVDTKGRVYRYGEFFPPELSPFSYNETIAQEYFPLSKEEALAKGYSWKDPEPRNYEITLKTEAIPDHITGVTDSILNEIIQCAHYYDIRVNPRFDQRESASTCNEQCTTAFRIIPQELEFYRKMNLPLPRLCPNCRHYQRIKQRNPLKLWQRKCTCAGAQSENGIYKNTAAHRHGQNHCPEEFETSYAPERMEIVYCEACYQSEVV